MARQATMNVSLTPKLQKYVRQKVRSGQYESASEVIRDSLRALQQRDRGENQFWQHVNRKMAEAREDVAAGRVVDGDKAMELLIAELDAADAPAPRRRRAS
jgi:antitoxin ParD1/3/4